MSHRVFQKIFKFHYKNSIRMNTGAQQVFREYGEHSRINFMCDNSHQIMFIRRSNCTTMVGMLTLGVDADWCGADDVRREAVMDADTGD